MANYVFWRRSKTKKLITLINEIASEVSDELTTPEDFLGQLGHTGWNPENRLLIAEASDNPIGYIDVWIDEYEDGVRATLTLGVSPSWRSQGIGSNLLRRALRDIPAEIYLIDVRVPEGAKALRQFLERRSFAIGSMTLNMAASARAMECLLPKGYGWRPFSTSTDRDKFRNLHNQSFGGLPNWRPITTDSMQYYLEANWLNRDRLLLIEELSSGEPVGWLWMNLEGEDRPSSVAYIESLGVHPLFRNQRLGRALLAKSFDWAEQHSACSVELSTDVENERAVQMYVNFGFSIVKRVFWYRKQTAAALPPKN